ncbi:MAG: mucoidy inhibitor MuiA family protein [candidate division WOR-3 bacterium]|nr:mucoidy inhibitor MuiA family protein [candidate division WOR-3 bacterium]
MTTLLLVLLSALGGLTVESKIDSVIIYPNQALVVRKATVNLTGSTQLNFKDLPGMLDDNTVRIKAEGLKIGEVQIKRGYIEKPSPRVKELEEKIKDVESDIRDLDNEKEVLKSKETFLSSVKLGAPELIAKELQAGKVAPESWRSGLKFMAEELAKTKERTTEIEDDKKELNDTLQALKKELNDVKALTENRKEVLVDIGVTESGTYMIELSYIIPGSVRWNPYYELRANPSEGKVGIGYFAKIMQRTGEDWENVKVLLSTAQPAKGGVAPEPYLWSLTLEEVVPKPAAVEKRAIMAEDFSRLPVTALKGELGVPRVETGISLQYVIPGRVSLKSGEAEKKIALYSASFPAEFEYYIYPRTQKIAYLKGKMLNMTENIFLAGEANAYVGSEFTGKTRLSNIAPEESTEASFGVDERVKVKHDLVKTFTSKVGTFTKRQRTEFLFKTIIENYHAKPVKFTLVEQVPVSQQKDITVKVTKIEPKFDEENKDMGTFTYTREIQPKEKFVVNLGYFVEYPIGRRVMGLY